MVLSSLVGFTGVPSWPTYVPLVRTYRVLFLPSTEGPYLASMPKIPLLTLSRYPVVS